MNIKEWNYEDQFWSFSSIVIVNLCGSNEVIYKAWSKEYDDSKVWIKQYVTLLDAEKAASKWFKERTKGFNYD